MIISHLNNKLSDTVCIEKIKKKKIFKVYKYYRIED
jgi:hypothetical protein